MIYVYLDMNITSPETFDQYKEIAADAKGKHGCSVLSIGKDNFTLDGRQNAPNIAVILSFPDKASALAWINDPELTHVHDLRRKAGLNSMTLIG